MISGAAAVDSPGGFDSMCLSLFEVSVKTPATFRRMLTETGLPDLL